VTLRHAVLGERALSVEDVEDLSADGTTVELSEAARARIAEARVIVMRHAAGDAPVYGLNTGLGGNLGHRLAPQEIEAFQTQIVRGRMIGVGEPLPRRVCRAALLCRIVELAGGRTGASPGAIETLIAMFARGVTPVLPRHGSLGASDIGLLAHMVAVAIGRGEAWFGERVLPGAEALSAAGIAPATLEPKDGLALVSNAAVAAALAALALARAGRLIVEQAAIAALAYEGFRANPAILDARLHAARPAAGQVEAAALMRAMLEGSGLGRPGVPARVQDALCFRVVAPVLGTLIWARGNAVRETEIELAGTSCSPLVLFDTEDMLSSPNYHSSSATLALDALSIALTHAAWATALRICKLMTASLSGLPRYLSPAGGASAGYVSLQKTAGSLYAEIRSRVAPTLTDALPVSDTVEDMASHTTLAAMRLGEQVETFRWLSAIEATAAAQAVDLQQDRTALGAAPAVLHAAIRRRVPTLETDREPGRDVEATRAVLDTDEVVAALAAIARAGNS